MHYTSSYAHSFIHSMTVVNGLSFNIFRREISTTELLEESGGMEKLNQWLHVPPGRYAGVRLQMPACEHSCYVYSVCLYTCECAGRKGSIHHRSMRPMYTGAPFYHTH